MTSWICPVCGFSHGEHEETCFGCHHPGTSLEHFIDCPFCGRETRAGGAWCDWCQSSLDTDDESDELTDDDEGVHFDDGEL